MDLNIFKELRKEHDLQRDIIGKLLKTNGDSEERKELYDELKIQLEEHAKFEERYFYKQLLNSDVMQEKARHSIAEHKELDDFIEKLDETDISSPSWIATAKKLEHRLEHHLDEEEHEFFQLAGKVLTKEQKEELGKKYRKNFDEEVHH